ncbi:hypothetical protein AOLI_G00064100 [Acnodon oligacanthus]
MDEQDRPSGQTREMTNIKELVRSPLFMVRYAYRLFAPLLKRRRGGDAASELPSARPSTLLLAGRSSSRPCVQQPSREDEARAFRGAH